MKKTIKWVIVFILIAGVISGITMVATSSDASDKTNDSRNDGIISKKSSPEGDKNVDKRSASYNGWLHTNKSKIVNENEETIQLTGISTHGIQWFGDLYNAQSIKQLKTEFGINVFRVAMYTDPNASGYVSNHELKKKVYELVDASIAEDMYVIIDWHILNDNNPQMYKSEALKFFDEVSKKYKDAPNVIYELCNEPNGDTQWNRDIRPYAKEVLAKIRKNSPKALVIVGTPMWDMDFGEVASKPLSDKNVAYALHFYAGTHKQDLRNQASEFLKKGLPLFVSECGSTLASGDGGVYGDSFLEWVDFMNSNSISWVYWSFSNKAEDSAIAKPSYVAPSGSNTGTGIAGQLTKSGELLKKAFQKK